MTKEIELPQREIKFRFWKSDDKEMVYLNLDDEGFGFLLRNYPPVMQYTGLKNKNGKEVYEGDIVKVNYEKGEKIGIVKYNNRFGMFVIDFGKEQDVVGDYGEKRSEVIGNIFENSDLLVK